MTIQEWRSCPLCQKAHQIEDHTYRVSIDGRLRFVCQSCRPTLPQSMPPGGRTNGPTSHGEDNRR
jgi:hypothetical protein